MKEREVIRRLRKAAKEEVSCDEQKKQMIISAVTEKGLSVRRTGSFGEFLVSQCSFINKTVVFWYMIWLFLFLYAVRKGEVFHFSNGILCILSMAPPTLLLLTVEEVSHIYNRSMLEIEYATKYSLKKVVMGRMLILSIINGIVLLIGLIYAGSKTGLDALDTLAYSLTPFVFMTFLLLIFMEKWKGGQLIYAGVSVYVILLLVVLVGRMEFLNIYSRNYLWIWLTLLAGSMLGAGYQVRKLCKVLEHFELLAD